MRQANHRQRPQGTWDPPARIVQEPDALPRFPVEGDEPQPLPSYTSKYESLAPVAYEPGDEPDEPEEIGPRPISPRARRFRAAFVFAAIMLPVTLLALVELVLIKGDEAVGWLPDSAMNYMASGQLGSSVAAAGLNSPRASSNEVAVSSVATPTTDDEARIHAATALRQSASLARAVCNADPSQATTTTLWVIVTVSEDGAVDTVRVEGDAAPQTVGCVESIAGRMRIPAFRGPPVTSAQKLVLQH